MMIPIKLKDFNDIEKINKIVTKYPFNIWIHGKSEMADAKSILGMCALKLNEPLQIVVLDDIDSGPLLNELKEFIDFS